MKLRYAGLIAIVCAPGSPASPGPLIAQQRAVVEFDHANGSARLITFHADRADTSALGESPVVRLPRSVPVEVRVVNTNTAVYRFSTETKSTALPETQSVQSFLSSLNPYLPELRSAATSALRREVRLGSKPVTDASAARSALSSSMTRARGSLASVGDALFGRAGLQENLTSSLLALEQMRQGVAPERASEGLRRSLGLGGPCREEAPVRLPTAQRLLTALSEVVQSAQELRGTMDIAASFNDEELRSLQDSARSVERQMQSAVSDFEPLVANAYRVERLVGIVAGACSSWVADTVRGSMTSGRDVTVKVEPRTEPETSRVADRPAVEFTVAIQPRAIIRPALGFIALAAPDARFSNYATREVTGGLQIYETGTKDARFNAGGTLGFTWPGLDYRETRGFAIWLPELVLAPGRNTSVGVGSSISFSFLKIGAGAVWIKHGALDGAQVGDVVADESGLQISDAYSSPKLYFSLGVFDWAPLAGRLK